MRRIALSIAIHMAGFLLVSALLLVAVVGRDGTLRLLLGDPDLGRVDFETLTRPLPETDGLVCPPTLCRAAQPDRAAPVFAVPARELARALKRVAEADPLTRRIAGDAGLGEERHLSRTLIFRFPDTIVVRYIELTRDHSTLALSSRSQIGSIDPDRNRLRLMRWIDRLSSEVPLRRDEP
jgi:hypothetical protein